jgi:hypothetical protein
LEALVRSLALTLLVLAGLFGPVRAAEAPPFVAVFKTNFPDPFVLPHGDEFLAYATNPDGAAVNVPMARSADLVNWTLVSSGKALHDAMPVLPPWAREGWTWAPEVLAHADGYLLYFTAKERRSGLQCVGVRARRRPARPLRQRRRRALGLPAQDRRDDRSARFRDSDGQLYLLQDDGNHPALPKADDIFVQRLRRRPQAGRASRRPLLRNDKAWRRTS